MAASRVATRWRSTTGARPARFSARLPLADLLGSPRGEAAPEDEVWDLSRSAAGRVAA